MIINSVIRAEQSAEANALRTFAIIRRTKNEIRVLKNQITDVLESNKDYADAQDKIRSYQKLLRNIKDQELEKCQDLVVKLKSKKDLLKAEETSLFGWLEEHVSETGQMSLFDKEEKKVLPIVRSFRLGI